MQMSLLLSVCPCALDIPENFAEIEPVLVDLKASTGKSLHSNIQQSVFRTLKDLKLEEEMDM